MSTKPKKKTVKTKKIKRAPLKLSYTEEEKLELKNKYDDILFHLSNFLSEHSVYEAVPENVKILVFSSELSFYEMIKVFIFEDIYCGLIYNPNLNNYLGLITTRDLMLLYKYIIDNFSGEKIENFDEYLKSIFKNFLFKTNLDIRNIRFKWINNKELTGLPRDKSKRKSNSQSRLMKELRESSAKRIREGKSQDIDLRNNKNKYNINVLSNSKTSLNLSKRDYDENENNKNRNIKLKTLSNSKSLNNINNKLVEHDEKIKYLFDKFDYKGELIKVNKSYEAYSSILDILDSSREEIIIVDPYADKKVLDLLKDINVSIILVTSDKSKINETIIESFSKEHSFRLIYNNIFHDRYLIIDKKEYYLCGTSINFIGNKISTIIKIESEVIKDYLLYEINNVIA